MSDPENVECPICSKEFSASSIEAHANKCLFLKEPALSPSGASKRPLLKWTTPPAKKAKRSQGTKGTKSISRIIEEGNTNDRKETETETETKIQKRDDAVSKKYVPLAERMRPSYLCEYFGQEHLLGPQKVLGQLLSKAEIPNLILWGPPGCGKTSLANVIANICKESAERKLRYVKLSAATSGVNDVKEAVSVASNERKFGRRTVMFMDEIHRFNKLQQDIFLPHVESGCITLIGATTENPSFSLNSALLSRCRVIVLEKLSSSNLTSILRRAVTLLRGRVIEKDGGDGERSDEADFAVDSETIQWLADSCDGDARIALGGLELAVQSRPSGDTSISLEDVKEGLKKTHMLYDRKGDQHYDIISALHKSVRASDDNAALYWLARLIAGGEDPLYIARRLVRMASEDVGLEDPKALGIAVQTMQGCKMIGMPECDVLLAQCVTYLARAPKSRLMEDALRAAQRLIKDHKGPQPSVPLHLRNAPTKLMKSLQYGKGYNIRHKDVSGLNYLPEELLGANFFGDEAASDSSSG